MFKKLMSRWNRFADRVDWVVVCIISSTVSILSAIATVIIAIMANK